MREEEEEASPVAGGRRGDEVGTSAPPLASPPLSHGGPSPGSTLTGLASCGHEI